MSELDDLKTASAAIEAKADRTIQLLGEAIALIQKLSQQPVINPADVEAIAVELQAKAAALDTAEVAASPSIEPAV